MVRIIYFFVAKNIFRSFTINMKILPIYDTRKNRNIALKNSNNYYLKLLSEQNEDVNTSQNVNFRGFLDLFKRERNFFTTLEATKLLNDAGIKEPNVRSEERR